MVCTHKGGQWIVRQVSVEHSSNTIEPPDDHGPERWKPFAVSDGFVFFRKFQPCKKCQPGNANGEKMIRDFYSQLD